MLTARQFWGRFFRSFYDKNEVHISARKETAFFVRHNHDYTDLVFGYKTVNFYESEFDVYQYIKSIAPIDISGIPVPILFALHEIGHTKTPEVHLNTDTRRRNNQYLDALETLKKEKKITNKEMNEIYHTTPFEVAADNWSFDYIKNNRKELDIFIKQFREIYRET